jgi:hypothetical protein
MLAAKKTKITQKKARTAARAAKKVFALKVAKRPAAWKRGGREWTRVLGHFGTAE